MSSVEENWLREFLIPEILRNGTFISDYSAEKSFEVKHIEISYISANEAFMLTKCYKAAIEYCYDGAVNTCNLVVKATPEIPKVVYEEVGFDSLFLNEVHGYKFALPKLVKFEEANTITAHPIPYPKYYYSNVKECEAIIVLGDFAADGWSMSKDRVNLSLEHIMLAVRNLGHFHGLGFALKHKDREAFNSIVSPLQESRYAKPHPAVWALMLRCGVKRVVNCARTHTNVPEDFIKRLDNLIGNQFEYGRKRVQPLEPYATLCHGDYLRNNVAYKYAADGEQHNNPIDVLMFDLQTLRYSSPMVDLATFLSLSAGKDVRPVYFDEIFKTYWMALSTTYANCTGDEVPEVLSLDNMLKEYVKFLPYSLGIAASFLAILFQAQDQSSEEMFKQSPTDEEIEKDALSRGGEAVDRELSALTQELFDHYNNLNVDIFDI